MRIAVLGTGAMGSRMTARLLAVGEHDITVWNRTRDRADELAAAGARVSATPADAARGRDLVLAMLRDGNASRAAWLGPDGALAGMGAGAVAVECSTVRPTWIRSLAARCAERSIAFLDAPVLGSRPQAEAGALVFLVGGEDTVRDQVTPVLQPMAAAVHATGPIGTGAQLKLLVNALFAVQVAAVGELLGALRGTSLGAARAVEVLSGTAVASPAATAAAAAVLRGDFAPAFPVELVIKDLTYAVDDAAERDAALPLVRTAAELYRRAAADGHADDNIASIAQLYAVWPA